MITDLLVKALKKFAESDFSKWLDEKSKEASNRKFLRNIQKTDDSFADAAIRMAAEGRTLEKTTSLIREELEGRHPALILHGVELATEARTLLDEKLKQDEQFRRDFQTYSGAHQGLEDERTAFAEAREKGGLTFAFESAKSAIMLPRTLFLIKKQIDFEERFRNTVFYPKQA